MSRLISNQTPEVIIRNDEPLILTSEQIEDYSKSFSYAEALYEEAKNQNELNRYVSECLILAENTTPYVKMQKLKALDEADANTMSIGDQSSSNTGWFQKIINFIKKIWSKFVEKITRWVTTNNYYLEKYKDIILKKEPKIGNISFDGSPCNFEEGIRNIMTVVISGLNTNSLENELPQAPGDNDPNANTVIKAYANKITNNALNGYQGNEEFKAWCVEFFEGKKSTQLQNEINPHNLKWTDMYNFCHDANRLLDTVKKDSDTLQKDSDAVVAALKQWYTNYKAGSDERRKQMNTDSENLAAHNKLISNTITVGNIPDYVKQDEGYKTANAEYDKYKRETSDPAQSAYNNVKDNPKDPNFNKLKQEYETTAAQLKKLEANRKAAVEKAITKHGEGLKQTQQNNATNSKTVASKEELEARKKANGESAVFSHFYNTYITEDYASDYRQLQARANDTTVTSTVTNGTTDKEIDAKITDIEKRGKTYINTGKDIIAAKFSAIEFIYSQYMKIIRAHVASYVGQPVDTSSNKPATSQTATQYVDPNNPPKNPAIPQSPNVQL